jgi:hypothetical protein
MTRRWPLLLITAILGAGCSNAGTIVSVASSPPPVVVSRTVAPAVASLAPTGSATPSVIPVGTPIVIASKYGGAQVIQVVKNAGTEWAHVATLTPVTILDADGSVASVGHVASAVPPEVAPGETAYVIGGAEAAPTASQKVQVTIETKPTVAPPHTYPLTKAKKTTAGTITGFATNDGSDEPVTFQVAAIFFDAAGRVVGDASTGLQSFPPGQTVPFEITVPDGLSGADYKLYAVPFTFN